MTTTGQVIEIPIDVLVLALVAASLVTAVVHHVAFMRKWPSRHLWYLAASLTWVCMVISGIVSVTWSVQLLLEAYYGGKL